MPKQYAGVVIEDAPLNAVYHYKIPANLAGQVRPGMRVSVPFGNRSASGFCVELSDASPVPENKLKEIKAVIGGDLEVPAEILALTKWIAQYYRCGWSEALAAAVPAPVRKGTKQKEILFASLAVAAEEAAKAAEGCEKKAPRQAAALRALLANGRQPAAGLCEQSGANLGALRSLEKRGLVALVSELESAQAERKTMSQSHAEVVLSEAQKSATAAIAAKLDEKAFGAFLLYGVTGSGKTEVYLQTLSHCLAQGRSAIILVPEISLTPQTVERFRRRSGEVAVLHSNMAAGERASEWRRLRSGEVRVAVGARSALFAPVANLGLVIVDEEHEPGYKQESAPRYHARDTAVVRARDAGAAIVLGSATPSLETWRNAQSGKYALLRLPARVTGAGKCKAEVVDMRKEFAEAKREVLFSRRLAEEMRLRLARKEQSIIFLNRRGFHTWIHCLNCKTVLECPDCAVSLSFHKGENLLRCHHCDYVLEPPHRCPTCGQPRLRFAGSGTERAEDIIKEFFPEARLLRMDSDSMTGRDSHIDALSSFSRGEMDILLGTQMVAKGHDFPNVTLAGVLSADGGINLPDFRASERVFQLVTQVVGRAGRAEKAGLGIVQAFDPDHDAVRLAVAQDFEAFAEHALIDRQHHGYPPFGRLARLVAQGEDKEKTRAALAGVVAIMRQANGESAPQMKAPLQAGQADKPQTGQAQLGGMQLSGLKTLRLDAEATGGDAKKAAAKPLARILGPSPCYIERIQAQWRFQAMIKSVDSRAIASLLDAADKEIRKSRVHIAVDVDPMSML